MFIKMIFSSLRINEMLSYCNEITSFLKSIDVENLQINTVVKKLNVKYEEALATSNQCQSSDSVELLYQNDSRKDESFLAFRNLMEASTHRKAYSIVSAAENICRIIRGHVWSLNLDDQNVQSAKMVSLCKSLALPENHKQIRHLDANSWYRDMIQDENAFNQLIQDKTKADVAKADFDAEEVYKELRLTCAELFDLIEVLNRITPNKEYDDMANFINECTHKYMIAARSRKTTNETANAEIIKTEA